MSDRCGKRFIAVILTSPHRGDFASSPEGKGKHETCCAIGTVAVLWNLARSKLLLIEAAAGAPLEHKPRKIQSIIGLSR
ncbi:MAG TPA: hypothetical protein VNM92_07975 [Thermoanaerobaculia bacterium]|nr:hypothetical protein [Thermoanaerobaculia bacterium]